MRAAALISWLRNIVQILYISPRFRIMSAIYDPIIEIADIQNNIQELKLPQRYRNVSQLTSLHNR